MPGLPSPPQNFTQRKQRILDQLSIPDSEYSDASPKGTVDLGIRDLIDEINNISGFVTTSSCAGRVSVFAEGRKAVPALHQNPGHEDQADVSTSTDPDRLVRKSEKLAAVGGKGAGGSWLFVSHEPIDLHTPDQDHDQPSTLLGLDGFKGSKSNTTEHNQSVPSNPSLVHFKFEPMILHVLTASVDHAQTLLRCGLQAGFRESGAVSLTTSSDEPATPVVGIRSMGLALESLVGTHIDNVTTMTVSQEYLRMLIEIANERFVENRIRVERFRQAVRDALGTQDVAKFKADGTKWEDATSRRERKKAEGLRRKAELQRMQAKAGEAKVEYMPQDVSLWTQ